MWIGILIGWILGSVLLYGVLVATAKEPQSGDCLDCQNTVCTDCPVLDNQTEEMEVRRAA